MSKKFQRVTLIAEPHDLFRDYLTRKACKELMESSGGDLVRAGLVQEATAVDLFGGVHVYLVECPSKADVEVAVKTLTNCSGEPWGGLVISTGAPMNSLRGLLKKAEELDVSVFKPKSSKNRVRKELEETGLSRPIVNFMVEHAGDDLNHVVPLLDFISTLPFDDRKRLTLQEVDHCIPVEPGTRAPWDILDALVRRDVAKVISAIDRAGGGSTFPLAVLKTKLSDTLKVASYLEFKPKASLDDVVQAFDGSKWSLKEPYALARRAGFQGIMEIANSLSAFLRNPNRNYSVDEFKDFCLGLCFK